MRHTRLKNNKGLGVKEKEKKTRLLIAGSTQEKQTLQYIAVLENDGRKRVIRENLRKGLERPKRSPIQASHASAFRAMVYEGISGDSRGIPPEGSEMANSAEYTGLRRQAAHLSERKKDGENILDPVHLRKRETRGPRKLNAMIATRAQLIGIRAEKLQVGREKKKKEHRGDYEWGKGHEKISTSWEGPSEPLADILIHLFS